MVSQRFFPSAVTMPLMQTSDERNMSEITFVAPPFLGHLTQMLAIAENLVARGHVVNVVTSGVREQVVRRAAAASSLET